MDNYQSGGLGAAIVFALGILYKIFAVVNHRRIRSNCCGKLLTASIDVEATSPVEEKTNPMVDAIHKTECSPERPSSDER